MKYLIFLLLLATLNSCVATKIPSSTPQIYWVNGIKVSCTGVAPMQCLQIQKGDTMVPGKWQNFYSGIDGFNFQSGYIYKLSIKEEKLDPLKVPADGSSIKFKLIEVLEKKPDPKFRINDIWALEAIKGEPVALQELNDKMETPAIEIQLSDMRIMGSDGCNRFQGQITGLDEEKIIFGPLAGTMKMCMNMEIPDNFNKSMNQVKKYKVENLKLYFFDKNGTETLRFKKVD